MARGQTTEDDLKEALEGVGALDSLRTAPALKRENLFGPPPRVLRPAPVPALEPANPAEVIPKAPPPEAAIAPPEPERKVSAPVVAAVPEARPERPARPPIEEPSVEVDRYTDPVTVPMTADMRTQANLLAAELQRRRTEKRVRFTPNTIFRVAIETFLERFELAPGDHVNSEEELRRLVHDRTGSTKRARRSP